MNAPPRLFAAITVILAIIISVSADTPEVNDIPTLAMRIKGSHASYIHRKPAPQEFRMLCNIALLHQAKGIFPYNCGQVLHFQQ